MVRVVIPPESLSAVPLRSLPPFLSLIVISSKVLNRIARCWDASSLAREIPFSARTSSASAASPLPLVISSLSWNRLSIELV